MSRKNSTRGGYTLIELLVVMSILAILYGIGSRLVAAGHMATEHVKAVNRHHQNAVQKHVDDIDADSTSGAPTALSAPLMTAVAAPEPTAAPQRQNTPVATQEASAAPVSAPAPAPPAPAGMPAPTDRVGLLGYAHRLVEENPQEGKPEPYVFEQNSGR